jgi:hypothetical protein
MTAFGTSKLTIESNDASVDASPTRFQTRDRGAGTRVRCVAAPATTIKQARCDATELDDLKCANEGSSGSTKVFEARESLHSRRTTPRSETLRVLIDVQIRLRAHVGTDAAVPKTAWDRSGDAVELHDRQMHPPAKSLHTQLELGAGPSTHERVRLGAGGSSRPTRPRLRRVERLRQPRLRRRQPVHRR